MTLAEENEILKEQIIQLKAALGDSVDVPVALGLTATEKRILGVIMKRVIAQHETIALVVARGRENLSYEGLTVHICNIRRKLKPFGLKIQLEYGVGYFMSAEHKAIIRRTREYELELAA